MSLATRLAISCTERGLLPDALIRKGIQQLVRQRLGEINAGDCERMADDANAFVQAMDESVIAPLPELANQQHYEVPAAFFDTVLGKHRKYSSCFFASPDAALDGAEEAALRIYCERAEIEDGMRILELGCGWGSLTLWLARQFPNSPITAVSNSNSQRQFIQREAMRQGAYQLSVVTADMNDFDTADRFDRVVSVEMFEHMRNYRRLFQRVHDWMVPGGKFFMHIFCHRSTPYEFVAKDDDDWMSRYFFSGGIMPSEDLPLRFQEHLRHLNLWRWSGTHYEKTANAWLRRMDANRSSLMPILIDTYGAEVAETWWVRWRLFFMACAELFGYNDGQEWWVSHYLFERPLS